MLGRRLPGPIPGEQAGPSFLLPCLSGGALQAPAGPLPQNPEPQLGGLTPALGQALSFPSDLFVSG